jgi:ATP-dependent DNA ligase
MGFDVLAIDGEDVRERPLHERKRRLRAIMPRIDSRLVYMDHVVGRGVDLFAAVCASDLEGVVAKWKHGRYYSDGGLTSWLKISNPQYSQMAGRPELFGARKIGGRSKQAKPVLCGELRAAAIGAVAAAIRRSQPMKSPGRCDDELTVPGRGRTTSRRA